MSVSEFAIDEGALTKPVTVRRYLGQTGTGDSYAPAATVMVRRESGRRLVTDQYGNETVAENTLFYYPTEAPIPLGSTVEFDGRTETVIAVDDPEDLDGALVYREVAIR